MDARQPACKTARMASVRVSVRAAGVILAALFGSLALSSCASATQGQIDSVVTCMQQKGWNVHQGNEPLSMTQEGAVEDLDEVISDENSCRQAAGLPPHGSPRLPDEDTLSDLESEKSN